MDNGKEKAPTLTIPSVIEVPADYCCPILLDDEPMRDPVTTVPAGQTYERLALEEWMQKSDRDPNTNVPITATVPNFALRKAIEDWVKKTGYVRLQERAVAATLPALTTSAPSAENRSTLTNSTSSVSSSFYSPLFDAIKGNHKPDATAIPSSRNNDAFAKGIAHDAIADWKMGQPITLKVLRPDDLKLGLMIKDQLVRLGVPEIDITFSTHYDTAEELTKLESHSLCPLGEAVVLTPTATTCTSSSTDARLEEAAGVSARKPLSPPSPAATAPTAPFAQATQADIEELIEEFELIPWDEAKSRGIKRASAVEKFKDNSVSPGRKVTIIKPTATTTRVLAAASTASSHANPAAAPSKPTNVVKPAQQPSNPTSKERRSQDEDPLGHIKVTNLTAPAPLSLSTEAYFASFPPVPSAPPIGTGHAQRSLPIGGYLITFPTTPSAPPQELLPSYASSTSFAHAQQFFQPAPPAQAHIPTPAIFSTSDYARRALVLMDTVQAFIDTQPPGNYDATAAAGYAATLLMAARQGDLPPLLAAPLDWGMPGEIVPIAINFFATHGGLVICPLEYTDFAQELEQRLNRGEAHLLRRELNQYAVGVPF